jgi:hypothetical protein
MRLLFTLVKASLLALLPFLFVTLKSSIINPDWSVGLLTPPLTNLIDPVNALLTVVFGYEAGARVVPTERDRSLFNFLIRTLNGYLENRATGYESGKLSSHALA